MARARQSLWLWAAALAVYAFLYLPLAVVVIFSFNDSLLNAEWVGFTTPWYETLFDDSEMLNAAVNSLFIAIAAASVASLRQAWPPCSGPWPAWPCSAGDRVFCAACLFWC